MASFEAIPHQKLMTAIEERVCDRHVLTLRAPREELARIRSDLDLLRAAGSGFPGAALGRAFEELDNLLRACLANWPAREALPMQADRDGLDNVTASLRAVTALPRYLGEDETVVGALASGRFS